MSSQSSNNPEGSFYSFSVFRISFTYLNVKWLAQGHTAGEWQSQRVTQAAAPCSATLLSFLPIESELLKTEVKHTFSLPKTITTRVMEVLKMLCHLFCLHLLIKVITLPLSCRCWVMVAFTSCLLTTEGLGTLRVRPQRRDWLWMLYMSMSGPRREVVTHPCVSGATLWGQGKWGLKMGP